ncbi:MAG: lipid A biosynthesis lauroyl acyltransferase [Thermodesulfovibrionia bacterium]
MKGKPLQLLEYLISYPIFSISRMMPHNLIDSISLSLGRILFAVSSKRRSIAMDNIRNALNIKDDREIKDLAINSFKSFFLTFLEIERIRSRSMRQMIAGIEKTFIKAKGIHDVTSGCIFVTPHLGNWELLPYIFSSVNIPLTVVVRPLDNPYLERLLNRQASGQVIVSRRDSIFMLKRTLNEGMSIGMLPDQSTMRGVSVDFFGRKATTTPLPAILAISCRRPIVVVSCCRGDKHYEGFVSEPIYPEYNSDKRDEILRLTTEMNRMMEDVIKRYPEQYLWMHNRWKTYRRKREFLSGII